MLKIERVKDNIVEILKKGGVGVLPTDTLYGLVGSALSEKAVGRIYQLKKRSDDKPFIILISDIKDLNLFGVRHMSDICLTPFWPGQVSVILDCPNLAKEMSYLRPFNNTLAFRCPNEKWLSNVLKKTGPLVAPSANPEGKEPAENIEQAKNYFACPVGSPAGDSFGGDSVDFYVDGGELKGKPSKIIKFENGKIIILRK